MGFHWHRALREDHVLEKIFGSSTEAVDEVRHCSSRGRALYNKQKSNAKRWDWTRLAWCRNSSGLVVLSKEGTQPSLSGCREGHLSGGATIRDVHDPTVIRDEALCHHVFKFFHVKLNKRPLLWNVALLVARELELDPAKGLNHMLLVLQPGADGYY